MKTRFYLLSLFFLVSVYIQAQQRITLLFAGDAMQHLAQIEDAQTPSGYNYDSCFVQVKNEIQSAGLAVVNLEAPLGGFPYSGYPQFCAPDAFAQALKKAGFDLFLTANNHCLDRREKGLERTIRQLDSLEVFRAGTYCSENECKRLHPLLLRKNGIRLAFLNYTYGTNGIQVRPPYIVNYIQFENILRDVETAKKNGADVIIVCPHWGDEYRTLPNVSQKKLADTLVDAGVHLIVGAHPHVVQPIDARLDSIGRIKSVVAYSLGNFISNMKTRTTMGSIVFKVDVVKDSSDIRIENPRYALIFTQRPVHVPEQGFTVLPAARWLAKGDSIPSSLSIPLTRFVQDTRKLFSQQNKGTVTEYEF